MRDLTFLGWARRASFCSDTSNCLPSGSPVMWRPWSHIGGQRRQTPNCSLLALTGMQTPAQSQGVSLRPPQFLLEIRRDSLPKNSFISSEMRLELKEGFRHSWYNVWNEVLLRLPKKKKKNVDVLFAHSSATWDRQALHLNDENSGAEDASSVKEPYLIESSNDWSTEMCTYWSLSYSFFTHFL